MSRNMTLGQYFPGDSFMHHCDPRTKIILSLTFMVLVVMADRWEEFLLPGCFIVIVALWSKIPVKTLLGSIRPMIPLVLFATIFNVFLVQGRPIFQFWIITATWEGLYLAIMMSVRILLIIVGGSSLMIFTTTPIMLTDGLERMLRPLKRLHVPVHDIAMIMTITMRFIPTLMEESDKIMKAQASRGATFNEGKLMDRIRSFLPIIVPLFVSAFRRADELADAMQARCYRGDDGRTRLRQLRYKRLDARAFAVFTLMSVLFFAVRILL